MFVLFVYAVVSPDCVVTTVRVSGVCSSVFMRFMKSIGLSPCYYYVFIGVSVEEYYYARVSDREIVADGGCVFDCADVGFGVYVCLVVVDSCDGAG